MALRMLRHIFRGHRKLSKGCLPNPCMEYKLVFKKGAIKQIQRWKGWKNNAEMARGLGLTRQYISMMDHGCSISTTVITRVAGILGNTGHGWWVPFVIVPWGEYDPNHPRLNLEKYRGTVKYRTFSASGEMRRLDYPAESF